MSTVSQPARAVADLRLPTRGYLAAKRVFDIVAATVLLLIMGIPMIVIAILIRLTNRGPALYWSERVGINNRIFRMPKFRSMRIDAPQLATHLFRDPDAYLTPIGGFLRCSSLDEFPQLFSILKGDISFVGPRPALFNQDDLVALRTERGVDKLIPGLTGWAQINGRDTIPIPQKVELDAWYLQHCSFWLDLKILFMTVFKVVRTEDISH
ncbi:MAG: sugar transferase [Terriglobia bacterium]|jgi:O-antigen biosynthesis protein WbqP|nr:sugar transferase [Terriglobia bacterium]